MKVVIPMIGLVLMGTLATLLTKALDLHNVKGVAFSHPYIQSLIMFLGELLCLIPYYIWTRTKDKESGTFSFAVPAAFDMLASTMCNFGLLLTSAGVYQMLRGSVVIIVALMSVTFLKRKLSIQQVIGVMLVFLGVTLVGTSSIQNAGTQSAIGIGLLAGAMFVAASQNVFEEHLMAKHDTHPLLLVGMEGAFGSIFLIILLPILNTVHCNLALCDHGHLENVSLAMKQLASDHFVQGAVIASIACISALNFCDKAVVKSSGAVAKCIVDTLRILGVWLLSLVFRWEPFDKIQLVGFVFLVCGNILYNEVLPFCKEKDTAKMEKEIKET